MRPLALVFTLLITTLICGCSEDTEIRSYKVAKRPTDRSSGDSTPTPGQTLGIIYPNANTAWFLKLMDSPEKVEALASEFRRLADSIRFDDNNQPEWARMDGWKDERPQQVTGFEAFAKFTHTSGVSATLTKLAANTNDLAKWQDYLTSNINRWRDQLSLPAQDWATMITELEEFPNHSIGDVKAYFVNIKGMRKGAGGGMGNAPFLERMRAQQAQAQQQAPSQHAPSQQQAPSQLQAQAQQQQGQPSSASDNPSAAAPPSPPARLQLKYQAPDDWQELPTSGIRLASFKIEQQDQAATVSISTSTGQVAAAVEMWLQQLGRQPDPQQVEQIMNSSTEGNVNNTGYRCYQLQSNTDQTAIRVFVIPLSSKENLYVKMTGTKWLVDMQSSVMDKFVSSLSWQL